MKKTFGNLRNPSSIYYFMKSRNLIEDGKKDYNWKKVNIEKVAESYE